MENIGCDKKCQDYCHNLLKLYKIRKLQVRERVMEKLKNAQKMEKQLKEML